MRKSKNRLQIVLFLVVVSTLIHPENSAYSLRNINVLNLLLPYSNEVKMKYVVQAFNGCYKWTSKFPETLQIGQLDPETRKQYLSGSDLEDSVKAKCQNAVMVSVGKRNNYDGIVWLTATDLETEQILKCEAKVKPITRLQILTKFRTLDVGDHEQVELIAFDEENNSFTTLEGLKFEWSVRGEGKADFVNFIDSNFKSTEERHKLENMNYQSDIVILKGLKTGKVTLTVKLLDRSYDRTITTSVDIFIIEHFEIEPQRDIFMLPCSMRQLELYTVRTVDYKLKRTRVSLPNSEFLWSTGDQTLAILHKNGMLKTSKALGNTKYVVRDRAKDDNKIERRVGVVVPRNINLYVKEISEQEARVAGLDSESEDLEGYENNWNLLKGRFYRVLAGLFDENDNRISLGENDSIKFKFQKNEFEVINREKDFLVLRPIQTIKKEEPLTAELNFPDPSCLPKKYQVRKQYSILSEIKLVKASMGAITLPNNGQEMRLFAMGGSGNYEWSSSNKQILQVKQNGVVVTFGVGMANVMVRDRNNMKNMAQLSIGVIQAASFKLVERKIEMLRGGSRELLYSAVDMQGNQFTYCTNLKFNFDSQGRRGLEIASQEFVTSSVQEALERNQQIRAYLKKTKPGMVRQMNSDYESIFTFDQYEDYLQENEVSKEELKNMFAYYQNYGICSGFEFTSDSPGEYDLKHALFKKKGIVRVYENYQFQNPAGYDKRLFSERPIILYGSMALFTFKEGPWTWKDSINSDKLKYSVRYVDPNHQSVVKIMGISEQDGDTKVLIQCLISDGKMGNEEIDVEIVGWNEEDEELLNPVKVRGMLRISCKIPSAVRMYKLKENDSERGYLNRERKKLGLNLGKDYNFTTELFDENEHLFWRKKSGLFDWVLDNSKLGRFSDRDKQEEINTLKLNKGTTGSGWAKVRLSGLKRKINRDGSYSGTINLSKSLEDKLQIEGLDKLTLSSDDILLYYHPNMEYELAVGNGSGDFKVTVDDEYLDYRYDFKGKKIIIKPKRLGSTSIQVEDLGTEAKMKATANIDIVEVRRIEAEIDHKVLEENKETPVQVRVYDEQERLIPKNQYHLMDLELGILGGKAQFADVKDVEDPVGDELYIVRPQKAGKYQLEITGKDFDGYLRKSNKVEIDVFEKMKVFPETILLAKGCVTSFEIRGGPNKSMRNNADFDITFEEENSIGELIPKGDGKFEFKARQDGQEEITIMLTNKRTKKVVGKVLVKIAVVNPTGIEIAGIESRKLLNSSLGRLIVIPTYNNMRFTPSLCPIDYEWTNFNPNIVTLERSSEEEGCGDLPKSGDGTIEEEVQNQLVDGWQASAKNVRANSPGFADVEITAHGYGRKFKTNVNLEVIEGMGVVRDKFIKVSGCEEGVILLPPNSSFQMRMEDVPLHSNSDYDFSILQSQHQKLLRTNANGFLRSSHQEGYVLLKISEKKNPQNELLVPVIIKKPVSLIIEDSSKISPVPVKSSMSLRARLIDSLGRAFVHPLKNFKLSVLSSDSSILDVYYNENKGEIEINTKKKGQATVMVAHPNRAQELLDILPIKVGSLISPSSPVEVHFGGNVNFKLNNQVLLDKSKWRSSNTEVVRIENGRVKAVGMGKAELRFDQTIKLTSQIQVFTVDQIVLEESLTNTLTNIPSRKEFKENYHFMFKLLAQGREINLLQSEQDKPEIDHNLTWGCSCSSPSFSVNRQKFLKPQNSLPYMGCIIRFSDFQNEGEWDFSPQTSLVFFLENKASGFRVEHRVSLHVIHGFFFADKSLESDPIQMDNASRSKEVLIRTQKMLIIDTEPAKLARFLKFDFNPKTSLLKLNLLLPEDFSDKRMLGHINLQSAESSQASRLVVVYDPSTTIMNRLANLTNFSFLFWKDMGFFDFILLLIALAALGILLMYMNCFRSRVQEEEAWRNRNFYK